MWSLELPLSLMPHYLLACIRTLANRQQSLCSWVYVSVRCLEHANHPLQYPYRSSCLGRATALQRQKIGKGQESATDQPQEHRNTFHLLSVHDRCSRSCVHIATATTRRSPSAFLLKQDFRDLLSHQMTKRMNQLGRVPQGFWSVSSRYAGQTAYHTQDCRCQTFLGPPSVILTTQQLL